MNTEENHTGVTVIVPGPDNAFANHYTAAAYVHNGFGKSAGLVQLEELGTLETPIALTNTLNVGKVWDALVDIVIEQCQSDGLEPMSINPVVGECNDCRINQIQKRAVGEKEVRQAFAAASEEFEEGDVGAGAGTICYGMKGGIGSASRVICIGEKENTIGVLVQSNFGATEDFILNGEAVGPKILEWKQEKDDMAASEEDKGSIMSILATDLPLTSSQLKRILKRTGVGIARTGGYTGHGSGEVMIGFTTANRIPSGREEELLQLSAIHAVADGTGAGADIPFFELLGSDRKSLPHFFFTNCTFLDLVDPAVIALANDRIDAHGFQPIILALLDHDSGKCIPNLSDI